MGAAKLCSDVNGWGQVGDTSVYSFDALSGGEKCLCGTNEVECATAGNNRCDKSSTGACSTAAKLCSDVNGWGQVGGTSVYSFDALSGGEKCLCGTNEVECATAGNNRCDKSSTGACSTAAK